MSHRNDISVLLALAAALATGPAAAAPKPVDSWGRAGVAYETYRTDSLECGLRGYTADVSQTEQAQAFVAATRQFEAIDSTSFSVGSPDRAIEQARRYEQVRRGIRPEKRMDELKQGMVAVVEDCLRERGYVQFRLTDEQREMLSHLDLGSEERREFLYRLASNPEVLAAQPLPPAAS